MAVEKIPLSRKILLSLLALVLPVVLVLKFIYGTVWFKNDLMGNLMIPVSLIPYIVVCTIISKRARKYFFSSNQQMLHNRSLFIFYYPLLYLWVIDDRLVNEKNNQ